MANFWTNFLKKFPKKIEKFEKIKKIGKSPKKIKRIDSENFQNFPVHTAARGGKNYDESCNRVKLDESYDIQERVVIKVKFTDSR